MVLPAVPIIASLLLGAVSAGASMYQQKNNKAVYAMNQEGYERKLRDWNKNVGSQGRTIRYPEHSYEGNIRSLGVSSVNADAAILRGATGYGSGAFSSLKRYV